MYLTWYNRYTRWTPAEGGFYLEGHTHEGNEYCELETRDEVIKELINTFHEALAHFGFDESDVKMEYDDIAGWTEWRAVQDDERIVLRISNKPLFHSYHEDDDGYQYEEYHSYVYYYKHSRYVDEIEEWECIPESRLGLHERPAIYC